MGSEWGASTLGDLAVIEMGQSPKGIECNSDGNGTPLLNGPTEFGSYHPYATQFTTDPKRFSKEDDLLFCVRGSTTGRMNWSDKNYAIGRGLAAFRHKAGSEYKSFLRGIIDSKLPELLSSATGSTFPNVSKKQLHDLEIRIPPLLEQKAIAHILGSLDDKIELNRQMNETLESMAQALFKSWFVDFDPVIDNALAAGNPIPEVFAERADQRRELNANAEKSPKSGGVSFSDSENSHQSLFPSEFEFTEEMGWIPKGWEVLPIPEVTEFREGPGVLAKDFHDSGIPLIRLAGLKNGVSLLDGCNYLDPEKVEKKWSHFRLKKGDILLSSSASLGRVAEVQSDAIGAIPYTGIIGFRPIENKSVRRYIRHYLISSHFQMQVEAMGVGSVLNHFGPTHIKKMNMPVPSLLVQNEFSNMVTPFDSEIAQRLNESNTIAKLRDTLLPTLLSGELRIPDAEKIIEEAQV